MSKVIQFPARRACHHGQHVGLPTLPVRQAIFEAWLEGKTGEQIANNLRVTAAQIRRVLWGFAEINSRQGRIARVRYRPQLEQMFREIEYEVWREAEQGPLFPQPTQKAA